MTYEPNYARGQINVFFREGILYGFVKYFAKNLGYRIANKYRKKSLRNLRNYYAIKISEGKEKEARDEFESYSKFVESTGLRDLRWEKRYTETDEQRLNLIYLRDHVEEFSREEYNNELEQIAEEIKDLKE